MYESFIIANNSTGIDTARQPWLIPTDANPVLLDSYVFRGVIEKRQGTSDFAYGTFGGTPLTESRIVNRITDEPLTTDATPGGPLVVGGASPGPYAFIYQNGSNPAQRAIRRGTATVTAGSQTVTDDGLGNFLQTAPVISITGITQANPAVVTTSGAHNLTTGQQVFIKSVLGMTQINSTPGVFYTITVTGANTFSLDGIDSTGFSSYTSGGEVQKLSGTIDYMTGAGSVTFVSNAGAVQLLGTYDYHPGLPVMGFPIFITAVNVKELFAFDEKFQNKYNISTNRLDSINKTVLISAITNANPAQITITAAHNLKTGDRVFLYGIQGAAGLRTTLNNQEFVITVNGATTFTIPVDTTASGAYTSGGTVEQIDSGTNDAFYSWINWPDKDGNVRFLFSNNNTNEIHYYRPDLTPTIGDYINYPTVAAPQFFMNDDAGVAVTSIKCMLMFAMKDRLLLLRTTESGVLKPRRIRISGTGAFSDDFRTSATGAGFIDIPEESWINGAAFNRDDLLIFTEYSTWRLSYTGNDIVPFTLVKVDESRGSGAPFGCLTYLNRTTAASTRALVYTDGYQVRRNDDMIPDYSIDEIDGDNFRLCFAGFVDEDRDQYLLHPSPGEEQSDRILVQNYDEFNYAVYRLALSIIGQYQVVKNITWADLTTENGYPTWQVLGSKFRNWTAFAFNVGVPVALGGGHHGQVWQLNSEETVDNPVAVRGVTNANPCVITTDYNSYQEGDLVYFQGVEGTSELNFQQFRIEAINSPYEFSLQNINADGSTNWGIYVPNTGRVMRVIPMEVSSKQLNPFVEKSTKIRVGWVYFYVSTDDDDSSQLFADITPIVSVSATNPAVINSPGSNLKTGDQVYTFRVGTMTGINDLVLTATRIDNDNFSVPFDGTTSGTGVGGFFTKKQPVFLEIEITLNDVGYPSTTAQPYRVLLQQNPQEVGTKRWYKLFVNQTARFIQYTIKNEQALTNVRVHAVILGVSPSGALY